jgi:hypothetical protein
MAESMMSFSVEIERIVELALMVLIGSALSAHWRELLNGRVILPVVAAFFVVRPFKAVPRLFIPIPSAVTAGGPGPVTRPAHDTARTSWSRQCQPSNVCNDQKDEHTRRPQGGEPYKAPKHRLHISPEVLTDLSGLTLPRKTQKEKVL